MENEKNKYNDAPTCPECQSSEIFYVQRVFEYYKLYSWPSKKSQDLDLNLDDSVPDHNYNPLITCIYCDSIFDLNGVKRNTVECKFCHLDVDAKSARLHQGKYVGECCCDDCLKITE